MPERPSFHILTIAMMGHPVVNVDIEAVVDVKAMGEPQRAQYPTRGVVMSGLVSTHTRAF